MTEFPNTNDVTVAKIAAALHIAENTLPKAEGISSGDYLVLVLRAYAYAYEIVESLIYRKIPMSEIVARIDEIGEALKQAHEK